MVKIITAVLTTIVLVTGTIQGAASYAEYCDDESDEDYRYFYQNIYGNNYTRCDFSNSNRQHDADVDFLTVVIVTGIAALSWVSSFIAG